MIWVLGQREGVPRKPSPVGALKIAERIRSGSKRVHVCRGHLYRYADRESGRDVYCGRTLGFRDREELLKGGADCIAEQPKDLLTIYEGKL